MLTAKRGGVTQSRMYLDKDLIPALGKIPVADVLSAMRRVESRGALNVASTVSHRAERDISVRHCAGLHSDKPDLRPEHRGNERAAGETQLNVSSGGAERIFLVAPSKFNGAGYTKSAIRIPAEGVKQFQKVIRAKGGE
ncbi:hypothetical protein [Pseudomonas purpurea]|uniref:hypothetical protein n=1 Tax=Pseudomonas purpurea TaxID=3136737 RepID=UPI0032633E77